MIENIKIIGTSHISSDSVNKIKKIFLEYDPDIVAVELDKDRLTALRNPSKNNKISLKQIRALGFTGWLFALFGKYAQKKLGSIVKLEPGTDMLMASNLAMKNKKELLLIDRHINKTLKRLSKQFGFKEKLRVFLDLIKGVFSKKARMKFDLRKVPEDKIIDKLLSIVKKSYPGLYSALIDERNHIMTRNIVIAAKKNPNKKILVVVGAGHKKEMQRLIPIYDKKIENIHS